MSTRDDVLNILIENADKSVSGSEIAKKLGISRNAVWKAVINLKEAGYVIKSVSNRGYTLINSGNAVKKELIEAALGSKNTFGDIIVFDEIDSTNSAAKQLAMQGAGEGTLICALRQSGGRGRLGRSFLSEGNGIYMSVILRPKQTVDKSLKITSGAAVAVRRVLSKYCGDVKIKWVNDVYINSKKVCGILTEAASDFESGGVEYIVVGIGINVFGKCGDFGEELAPIVTTIEENTESALDKNTIIAEVYRELMDIYSRLDDFGEVMKEYKEYSMVIGKDVYAIRGGEKKAVKIVDIDGDGALIALCGDGRCERLSSGEISIRFN